MKVTWGNIRRKVEELSNLVKGRGNIRIVRSGNNDTVTVTDNGILINLRKFPDAIQGVGGGAEETYPLQPVQVGDDKVKFRWGTVNGYTPKIGTDEITSNVNDAANPEFTITGAGYIYVKVDVSSTFVIDNPVLEFAATVPTDTTTNAYRSIVNVGWTSGAITSLAPAHRGSIEVATCGGVLYYWDLGQTNDVYYTYYDGEYYGGY